jgi:hypothetical protein
MQIGFTSFVDLCKQTVAYPPALLSSPHTKPSRHPIICNSRCLKTCTFKWPLGNVHSLSLGSTQRQKIELKKIAVELWKDTFSNPRPALEPRDNNLTTPDGSSFELFSRLPRELRDKIWAFAAHVDLDPSASIRSLFVWRCIQHDPWEPTQWEESEPILVLPLRRRMRRIPLFWACQAARQAAIAAYGGPKRGDIIFNPAVDNVHVISLGDDVESEYDEKDQKLIGHKGSNTFQAVNLYSDTGGIRYTIVRCPLSNSDSLSRELYQYPEPYEMEARPFQGQQANHRFYGISKCLQRRVRYVCVSLAIRMMIQTFSSSGPVARGLEDTLERFPNVESVTI